MNKFNEKLEQTRNLLKSTLTKESTKEEIDRVNKLDASLNELEKDHKELETEFNSIKSDYVDLIRKGTKDKPSNEIPNDESKGILDDEKGIESDMRKFIKANEDNK